jgi:ApbE superfamily uncharacterized protein (UPF0280 family)
MNHNRFYRNWVSSDLVNFTVREEETDIFISAEKNLKKEARESIRARRTEIIDYIKDNPRFEKSLEPLSRDEKAPKIVQAMLCAAEATNVGPMAAVAGAVSEFVGKALLKFTKEIILENGGDIFIKTNIERKISVYAGESSLSGKIGIKIRPGSLPIGVCTSSGTVGHSLSFGKADAACVVARDTALADACATATCNKVKNADDIEAALNFAKSIEGIIGAVVIYGDRVGSIGDIELA